MIVNHHLEDHFEMVPKRNGKKIGFINTMTLPNETEQTNISGVVWAIDVLTRHFLQVSDGST